MTSFLFKNPHLRSISPHSKIQVIKVYSDAVAWWMHYNETRYIGEVSCIVWDFENNFWFFRCEWLVFVQLLKTPTVDIIHQLVASNFCHSRYLYSWLVIHKKLLTKNESSTFKIVTIKGYIHFQKFNFDSQPYAYLYEIQFPSK